MENSDDAHITTDTIYKNLSDSFNAGVRQIVITGKAYQKALVGVASAARSFHEALASVGSSARLCKGGTEQIGEAIQQIAEAQRDIQDKLDDSTKILISDVILPLEHKLDHDFRNVTLEQRKYHHGHKTIWGPYSKAHESLKKFRKKSRNKIPYNEQKEAEYVKTLNKCQERLEKYRMQGLKLALVEERKYHCFLLEKLCAYTSLQMVCHQKACNALSPLPEWKQLCANPLALPPSGEHMVTLSQEGPMNGSAGFPEENRYMYPTRSAHGQIHRSRSAAHLDSLRDEEFKIGKSLPVRSSMVPLPLGTLKMRALYAHTGETEEQLGFTEGDIIVLVGEKSDGWQYGQNLSSGRYGWFPLSFTEPFNNNEPPDLMQSYSKMGQRVRSVGDLLDSRSLSDQSYGSHDIPGNARRPNTMFEDSSFNVVSSVSQQPHPPSPDTIGPPGRNSILHGNPGQQPSYPPTPPPPPAPRSQNHPPVDYGGVEEDVIFQSNPKFGNVSLRKAVTNDRSAPKIK